LVLFRYAENCGIYGGKIVVFDLGYVKGTNKKSITKTITKETKGDKKYYGLYDLSG
jgi:hypothetical protein